MKLCRGFTLLISLLALAACQTQEQLSQPEPVSCPQPEPVECPVCEVMICPDPEPQVIEKEVVRYLPAPEPVKQVPVAEKPMIGALEWVKVEPSDPAWPRMLFAHKSVA